MTFLFGFLRTYVLLFIDDFPIHIVKLRRTCIKDFPKTYVLLVLTLR